MPTVLIALICSSFSSGFFLSKNRIKTACKYSSQVVKQSKKNGIDPLLFSSLIYVESGWKKTAVSPMGACGLTQVMPKYTGKITRKYTCEQLKNPLVSIKAGTRILKWWIDYHESKLTNKQKNKMTPADIKRYTTLRGLCGYNAGFRCSGLRPNKHGMRYARKILSIQKKIGSNSRKKSE